MNVCLSLASHLPPWRNWLARSAVNREAGGSSPPGGDSIFYVCIMVGRREHCCVYRCVP